MQEWREKGFGSDPDNVEHLVAHWSGIAPFKGLGGVQCSGARYARVVVHI